MESSSRASVAHPPSSGCANSSLDRPLAGCRLTLRWPIRAIPVVLRTDRGRYAPTTGALEPIDEHSCTLRAGSNSLDELAIYVTTKGFDFQVHEPPKLVEHVRTLAARLAGATD